MSGNYFETLGVQPWLGLLFTQADDRNPGGHPVAVLSYEYWQRRFGGDPGIVGGKLILNDRPMTVVGITPPGFYGTDLSEVTDIRVPMMMATVFRPFPANRLEKTGHEWMEVLARLKPQVSRSRAEAGLDVLYRQVHENEIQALPPRVSEYNKRVARSSHIKLLPGSQGSATNPRTVLARACDSLRHHLHHPAHHLRQPGQSFPRPECRPRPGDRDAPRPRRHAGLLQWLTESLLFASLGGGLGVLVAIWTQSALLHFLPANERINLGQTTLDPVVFGFALAAAFATAILFGIIPALQISRGVPPPQQGDPRLVRSDLSPRRFRGGLVLLQIGLSLRC